VENSEQDKMMSRISTRELVAMAENMSVSEYLIGTITKIQEEMKSFGAEYTVRGISDEEWLKDNYQTGEEK